jgi:hypothetical protein
MDKVGKPLRTSEVSKEERDCKIGDLGASALEIGGILRPKTETPGIVGNADEIVLFLTIYCDCRMCPFRLRF